MLHIPIGRTWEVVRTAPGTGALGSDPRALDDGDETGDGRDVDDTSGVEGGRVLGEEGREAEWAVCQQPVRRISGYQRTQKSLAKRNIGSVHRKAES